MCEQFPIGRSADGRAGLQAFREERARWYLRVTDTPLVGTVAEQNVRFDIIYRTAIPRV